MKEQITLTYCGRRLDRTEKKIFFEFDRDGRTLAYSKVRHGVVGGIYVVDADTDTDAGRLSIYPASLRYTGEKITDLAQIAVWEAADRDAYDTSRELAAERKHAKSSELDTAIAPLVEVIVKASTRAEAQAIMRVVTAKLDRAWWDR